ncbi:MAG: hypothetical protein MUF35_01045 [Candidatus Nanopelagicales bacterium]|nr:hypothetical protein [Candidatus Nanopelagicales bacterium]
MEKRISLHLTWSMTNTFVYVSRNITIVEVVIIAANRPYIRRWECWSDPWSAAASPA